MWHSTTAAHEFWFCAAHVTDIKNNIQNKKHWGVADPAPKTIRIAWDRTFDDLASKAMGFDSGEQMIEVILHPFRYVVRHQLGFRFTGFERGSHAGFNSPLTMKDLSEEVWSLTRTWGTYIGFTGLDSIEKPRDERLKEDVAGVGVVGGYHSLVFVGKLADRYYEATGQDIHQERSWTLTRFTVSSPPKLDQAMEILAKAGSFPKHLVPALAEEGSVKGIPAVGLLPKLTSAMRD